MIRGIVNASAEAVVRLRVRGPGGVESSVEAMVDTGFTAYLTLPSPIVSALGLVRRSGGSAVLGDGAASQFDVCTAEVEWGGTWRAVLVYVLGTEPLFGMRSMAGHKLVIDVVAGGLVEILPLP